MPNGFTPGPGMPPASGVTSAPGMPGAMPATTPSVETTEEEVSGQRIGTVNGVRIYRGQNTYMFESVKKRKIVRHLVPNTSPTTANLPPATTAQPANHKVPNLPSMVGRPNPQ